MLRRPADARPPRQRRAGDRRVARQGEDDQEVPRRGLHREGVGRPREGSAQEEDGHRHRARLPARVRGHRRQEEGAGGDQGGRQERRAASCWRPTPIAKGRPSPGTSPRRSRPSNPNIQRVLFNEITKKAINEAIGKPMELDIKKFESQQARRILDRLVGYQISPVLWTKVQARAVGRPRAVGGGAAGGRARGGDHAPSSPRSTGPSRRRWRGRAAAVHRQGREARRQEGRADATRARRARSSTIIKSASLRGRQRRAQGAAQEPAAAVHHLQAAAGGLEQAALLAQADDGRSRSGSTKASRSATRAWSVSSPTCVPTRPASRTTPSPRRARYIGERYGANFAARRADRLQEQEGAQDAHEAIRPTSLKYDPETVRAAWAGGKGGGRDERETRGSAEALHADLEPLRRLPDGGGGLRSDRDRHRAPGGSSCAPAVR